MPIVYIPHLPTRYDPIANGHVPTFNLTPAERWGELMVLNAPGRNPRNSAEHLEQSLEQVKLYMADIAPEDYIVAIGDVVVLSSAIAQAINRNGSVNVLRWHKNTQEYEAVKVPT